MLTPNEVLALKIITRLAEIGAISRDDIRQELALILDAVVESLKETSGKA